MKQMPAHRVARGFGLVEIMVALVLGLLVVAAAGTAFVATRQTSTTTDSLSRMQESVRTAAELLSREVREARNNPCNSQVSMANVLNNAATTWWANWDEPLTGYGGSDAFAGAAFGSGTGQRVAGTEAMQLKYVDSLRDLTITAHNNGAATFTVNPMAHGVQAGDVLVACNYNQGAIFQATNAVESSGTIIHSMAAATPGNCSLGLGYPQDCSSAAGNAYQFPAGSKMGRLIASGWYIGNNGRSETGGRSLFRVTPNGAQEVAEGVRDMQITYLLTGSSSYVSAASVGAPANWGQVVGMRVMLTFESVDRVSTASAGQRVQRSITLNLATR